MKTTKKYQVMTNTEVKKCAKAEAKAINTNPTYLMRKLNKFAQGKESDLSDLKKAQEVSVIGIAELYNRLEEAFVQGGFWWGSVMAREGILSIRETALSGRRLSMGSYIALGLLLHGVSRIS